MRYRVPTLLALSLIGLYAPPSLHAQWMQTAGPVGRGLTSFASLNGSIFACDGGGIFRSTDDGLHWTGGGYVWPTDVTSLTADETRLFAGTKAGDVLISTDSGVRWLSIRHDLPASPVSILLVQGDTMLAVLGRDSIYRSTNGGMQWVPSGQGGAHPGPFIYDLICRDSCVLAGGYNGVFRSTDMGLRWTRSNQGLTDTSIYALAFKDSLVFTGTRDEGVFVSSDLGQTWSPTQPPPLSTAGVWTIITSGAALYAGTQVGVCASTDNGGSWSTVSNGLPERPNGVVWELFSTTQTIIARTSQGQFRSTNGGAVWTPADSGLPNATVYALYASPMGIFAGTQARGGFYTDDHGTSWHPRNSGLLDTVITGDIYAFAGYGRYLFAGTGNDAYRSSDQGASWARTRLTTGNVTAFAVRDSMLFASWSGVSRSSDSGATWQQTIYGLTDGVVALVMRGKSVIAGSSWSGAYRSTNNGDSWTRGIGTANVGIECLLGTDSMFYAGTYGKGVYCSSDDGEHWSPTVGSPGSLYIWAMASVRGTVFAGTQKGIYASSDGGVSWNNVTSTGTDCPIYALLADDTYLYAGTSERGVWCRPLKELATSVASVTNVRPSDLSLEQNFPNPFNSTTTIRYTVGHASRIVMRVFNVLGEPVATLVDQVQEEGVYLVRWDAANVPSGLYFVQIRSSAHTRATRVVVLK